MTSLGGLVPGSLLAPSLAAPLTPRRQRVECLPVSSPGVKPSTVKSERIQRGINRRLSRLPIGARRELLRVLNSPSETRADVIRQMHERPITRDLAEALMDLEAEPLLRLQVMEALKDSLSKAPY